MIFEKGYLFPPSFLEILETFTRPADRDALSMAIHRYMYRGEEPVFSSMNLKRTWLGIFPYLKKSRNAALARDGEESQDEIETISGESQDEVKTNSGQSRDIKDKGLKIKDSRESREKKSQDKPAPSPSRFVPPKLEQVREYCNARGNTVSPERFIAFYESKGWKVGKTPMRDWQACVRNWEFRDRDEQMAGREPEKPQPVKAPKAAACPGCKSKKIQQRGDQLICDQCGCSFHWDGYRKTWKEEA